MMLSIFVIVIIIAGLLFFVGAVVGLVRFPDFYTRMHAAGKCDTLGTMLVVAGLAMLNGWSVVSAKLLIVLVFIVVANPTATHAIMRVALVCRVLPWSREGEG